MYSEIPDSFTLTKINGALRLNKIDLELPEKTQLFQ